MTQSIETTALDSSMCSLLDSLADRDQTVPADFRPPVEALDPADASECTSLHHLKNENRVACFDGLSEQQRLAIELLVMGEREGKVAKKVGVNRSTLWRWRQDPRFCRALAAAREMAFGAAVDRLRSLVPEAVELLLHKVRCGSETAALRLLRLLRIDRQCASPTEIPGKPAAEPTHEPAHQQPHPLLDAPDPEAAIVRVWPARENSIRENSNRET